jgi:hypothetical protein
MRAVFAATVLVGLAACSAPNTTAPAAAAAGPSPAAAVAVQPGLRWEMAVSGAGASLKLLEPTGAAALALACVRAPAQMTVTVESFGRIASEERLSFGVDDEPFVFVADLGGERPSGVEASAPINTDLLDRLERANAVSASYGAQVLGPRMPPDPEQARRFATACREVARAG